MCVEKPMPRHRAAVGDRFIETPLSNVSELRHPAGGEQPKPVKITPSNFRHFYGEIF
jgi:hypothetical protein